MIDHNDSTVSLTAVPPASVPAVSGPASGSSSATDGAVAPSAGLWIRFVTLTAIGLAIMFGGVALYNGPPPASAAEAAGSSSHSAAVQTSAGRIGLVGFNDDLGDSAKATGKCAWKAAGGGFRPGKVWKAIKKRKLPKLSDAYVPGHPYVVGGVIIGCTLWSAEPAG